MKFIKVRPFIFLIFGTLFLYFIFVSVVTVRVKYSEQKQEEKLNATPLYRYRTTVDTVVFGLNVIKKLDTLCGITFTNDNWKSSTDLASFNDSWWEINGEPYRIYIAGNYIGSLTNAVTLARSLNSYEKCIKYNDSVYYLAKLKTEAYRREFDSIAKTKIIEIY